MFDCEVSSATCATDSCYTFLRIRPPRTERQESPSSSEDEKAKKAQTKLKVVLSVSSPSIRGLISILNQGISVSKQPPEFQHVQPTEVSLLCAPRSACSLYTDCTEVEVEQEAQRESFRKGRKGRQKVREALRPSIMLMYCSLSCMQVRYRLVQGKSSASSKGRDKARNRLPAFSSHGQSPIFQSASPRSRSQSGSRDRRPSANPCFTHVAGKAPRKLAQIVLIHVVNTGPTHVSRMMTSTPATHLGTFWTHAIKDNTIYL